MSAIIEEPETAEDRALEAAAEYENRCRRARPTFETEERAVPSGNVRLVARWENPAGERCAFCIEHEPGASSEKRARNLAQLMLGAYETIARSHG